MEQPGEHLVSGGDARGLADLLKRGERLAQVEPRAVVASEGELGLAQREERARLDELVAVLPRAEERSGERPRGVVEGAALVEDLSREQQRPRALSHALSALEGEARALRGGEGVVDASLVHAREGEAAEEVPFEVSAIERGRAGEGVFEGRRGVVVAALTLRAPRPRGPEREQRRLGRARGEGVVELAVDDVEVRREARRSKHRRGLIEPREGASEAALRGGGAGLVDARRDGGEVGLLAVERDDARVDPAPRVLREPVARAGEEVLRVAVDHIGRAPRALELARREGPHGLGEREPHAARGELLLRADEAPRDEV